MSLESGHDVLPILVAAFPDFQDWLEADESLFDLSSPCGAFSEFSHFARDRASAGGVDSLERLGGLIREIREKSEPKLEEALDTCLIENLSTEPFSAALLPHLDRESAEYLKSWGV